MIAGFLTMTKSHKRNAILLYQARVMGIKDEFVPVVLETFNSFQGRNIGQNTGALDTRVGQDSTVCACFLACIFIINMRIPQKVVFENIGYLDGVNKTVVKANYSTLFGGHEKDIGAAFDAVLKRKVSHVLRVGFDLGKRSARDRAKPVASVPTQDFVREKS